MKNIYFEDVIGIGNLYLDYIFYEFEYEPILFTCVDEKDDLYLSICSDIRYGQRWIVAKCTIGVLKALIEKKIDIATAFLKNENVAAITMDLDGQEHSAVIERSQIDRLDLPKEETYIRSNNDVKDYLRRKEFENTYQIINETMEITQAAAEEIQNYSLILSYYISQSAKEALKSTELLAQAIKESMMICHEYSVNAVEKYSEKIDSMDVDIADNNDYIQAA